MNIIVHSPEDLAAALRRGLSPLTDNPDALRSLGFERAYPNAQRGFNALIWERRIEYCGGDGRRAFIRQRAFLIEDVAAMRAAMWRKTPLPRGVRGPQSSLG